MPPRSRRAGASRARCRRSLLLLHEVGRRLWRRPEPCLTKGSVSSANATLRRRLTPAPRVRGRDPRIPSQQSPPPGSRHATIPAAQIARPATRATKGVNTHELAHPLGSPTGSARGRARPHPARRGAIQCEGSDPAATRTRMIARQNAPGRRRRRFADWIGWISAERTAAGGASRSRLLH
jgi:hypothetical protein